MTLRLALLLLLLYIVSIAAIGFVSYQYGRVATGVEASNDIATEKSRCLVANQKQISNTLNHFQKITADNNAASFALSKAIATKKLADQQTTKEIRYALSTTSRLPVDCVFDNNIMQQLSAARDRANTATTAGFDNALRGDTTIGK